MTVRYLNQTPILPKQEIKTKKKKRVCTVTGLFLCPCFLCSASLMAQQERILLPMQEIQFLSLEQKDLLEKEMMTPFSKEIPWTEELAGTVHGITKS